RRGRRGRRDVEPHPLCGRSVRPRSGGCCSECGRPRAHIFPGFRPGRSAIAPPLDPADVEALRRDPIFAAAFREAPSLSTYFIIFNRHKGPMSEAAQRRIVAEAIDAPTLVKHTLGRRAIPAHSLIPPGLLGYEPRPPEAARPATPTLVDRLGAADLIASVHPTFFGEHAPFYAAVEAAFRSAGAALTPGNGPVVREYLDSWVKGNTD